MKYLFLLLMVGCSSNYSTEECMPANATYTQYMSVTSGFCPEIPPTLITIKNGIFPVGDGVECQEMEQQECSVKQADCSYRADNCEVLSNTRLTFNQDGKSATGFISVTLLCDGQFRCAGTYDVKLELKE